MHGAALLAAGILPELGFLSKLQEIASLQPLLVIGLLLLAGTFLGQLAAKFRLPEVTGFVVAGLLMGDAVLGLVHHNHSATLSMVTEVALGLIALTIGGEFYWIKLKRMGKAVLIITAVQLFASFGAVSLSLVLFGMELPFAMMLGAIASATAPAATVAIVQALRARGPFVDHLYGVVALDDAGCVVLFGVVFAVASGMLQPDSSSGAMLVLTACGEVLLSVLLGAVSGLTIHLLTRKRSNTSELLILTLGVFLVTTAIALSLHLSPLLTNMACGALIINMGARNHRIFRSLEPISPPIYALFFVLAGTELEPGVALRGEILLLGSVYVVFRALGKYAGVYVGAVLGKSETAIRNYLGFCMLPQAGVAIGLVLLVENSPLLSSIEAGARQNIDTMVSIVLLAVFVNELLGPPLSRWALIRGNDMEEVARGSL